MSEKNEKDLKLDALAATKLLENVFEECDVEPNTVPMEALSAYSGYRKERFFLQRLILVIAIVLFLMLPFLFISPDYKVSEADGKTIYQLDYRLEVMWAYIEWATDGSLSA